MGRYKFNKFYKKTIALSVATMISTTMIGGELAVVNAEINESNSHIIIEEEEFVDNNEIEIVEENEKEFNVGLIINEVYGGGGKAGKDGKPNAPYAYDFIEMYNPTDGDIELKGLKLKYTNNSAGTIQEYIFEEEQVIKANDYFLLRCEATVGNMGEKGHGEIFNADAFYDIPEQGIGMSDTKGSIQLLTSEDEEIDAVNFGGAENGIGEGNSIKGVNYLTAVQRKNFQDTNNNLEDFEVAKPTPQMSGGEVQILEIKKIEDVKLDESLVGETVYIEATITAKNISTSNESNDKVTYIQDFTGGIALINIDNSQLEVGQKVLVSGKLTKVNGELRVDTKSVSLLSTIIAAHPATPFTANEAIRNDGWYASISGKITSKEANKLVIDNTLEIYANNSIPLDKLEVGQLINAKGILSVVNETTRLVVFDEKQLESVKSNYESTLDISKIAGYDTGVADEDGGVAEIVKFNSDNNKFYLINGKMQTIDIVSLGELKDEKGQVLEKEKSLNIADAVNEDGFVYGDLTSIDINIDKKIIVAAVQDEDYRKSGKIVVMNYDCEILETFETGIQPDMVKISKNGKHILTANEAEPREGKNGEGWDPEGSITIVNYETKEAKNIKFDDSSKIDSDVHIRNTQGGAALDLEPEYIAISDDGNKAYVSLQENNAIATIDVNSGDLISVKSLGFKDHSIKGNELDAGRDGKINIENLPIKSLYMPDSIAYVNICGTNYIVTANEGDATEWGKKDEAFTNINEFGKYFEGKDFNITDSTFGGMTASEAKSKFEEMKASGDYDKLEVLTDMGDDSIYILGGRSFAIWNADNMDLVYDSGSDFEKITAEVLPEGFNWSNDDNVMDKRSAKKGPEPEDVKIGKVGDKIYAFVGLERVGGVMTYDITNPSEAKYANYINTRDFTNKVAGDVAPEGLEFIAAEDSLTGKPLVLVGNEVSGTVSVLQLETEVEIPEEGPEEKPEEKPTETPDDDVNNPSGKPESKPEINNGNTNKPGKLPYTGGTSGVASVILGITSLLGGAYAFKRKKK